MLVLSRKPGDRIVAGNVVFKVLRIDSRSRTRIGIEAPDSIRICRGEVAGENTPPDFEAAAEHVVALCDETFADVDSMPPVIAELYRAATNVVGAGLVELAEELTGLTEPVPQAA